MRRIAVVIVSLMILVGAFAQDSCYLGVAYTPGFLLAHRADIKGLAAHNWGVNVSYELDRTETDWGGYYRKPVVGFGVGYNNLGSDVTGHAVSGFTHIKFALIQRKHVDLRFKMGAGLAYLTEKFEPLENRRNQAIGSHLNGTMHFGLLSHIDLDKQHSYVELGIGITHFSNAAFKVPNLGYNIPHLTARYGFGLGRVASEDSIRLNPSQWTSSLTLIYGKKQRNFANPQDFYNFGLQARALRHVSLVKAWRMGVDYTLDKSYKYSEDASYPLDSISLLDKSEVAIAGGFQWTFGKVDVVTEVGAYLYKPAVLKNALSQRIGLVYRVSQHLSTQGTLRFHRGVADFFEIGVGYTL